MIVLSYNILVLRAVSDVNLTSLEMTNFYTIDFTISLFHMSFIGMNVKYLNFETTSLNVLFIIYLMTLLFT